MPISVLLSSFVSTIWWFCERPGHFLVGNSNCGTTIQIFPKNFKFSTNFQWNFQQEFEILGNFFGGHWWEIQIVAPHFKFLAGNSNCSTTIQIFGGKFKLWHENSYFCRKILNFRRIFSEKFRFSARIWNFGRFVRRSLVVNSNCGTTIQFLAGNSNCGTKIQIFAQKF